MLVFQKISKSSTVRSREPSRTDILYKKTSRGKPQTSHNCYKNLVARWSANSVNRSEASGLTISNHSSSEIQAPIKVANPQAFSFLLS